MMCGIVLPIWPDAVQIAIIAVFSVCTVIEHKENRSDQRRIEYNVVGHDMI